MTGKRGLGRKYAVATRAHSETVLRVFYDFHRDAGTGPMVNPFPLSRQRRGGRPNAHHNPMEPFRNERVGLYRPRVAQRIPRCIPDEMFNRVLPSSVAIVTGHWSRCGCGPERVPRSCSAPAAATSTPVSSSSQ